MLRYSLFRRTFSPRFSSLSRYSFSPVASVRSPTVDPRSNFSIKDKIGALDEVLSTLKKLNISLTRIESRPSRSNGYYEFVIDLEVTQTSLLTNVVDELKKTVSLVKVVSIGTSDADFPEEAIQSVPWFPRKIADLDSFADRVVAFGADLDSNHPGFIDSEYRARRAEITNLARNYKHGDKLPSVSYTKQEIETWGHVFKHLTKLYPTHACQEMLYVFPLLVQNCGFREDNIPQLEHVSRFLKDCTGWTVRPVMGLMSSRDFLNALAFRVFHSTQYIRHHSKPLYTPEPDVCHELLGHVPLYADPDFADFSQEIGLASLGATDEDLTKLSTIYWFTVEFGICRQNNKLKAYGAGLLSSFGELEYCLTDKAKYLPFDPEVAAVHPFPITSYQPVYFVAESFKDMKEKVRDFSSSLKRPFGTRYNALTESIEVLDTKDSILKYAKSIGSDVDRLIGAMERFNGF
ncbi:hypothetical protein HK098_006876 [Nowakowskiella sp. JEL0407]|nr:hypothetical protein HK098_006876 [Nowakowskiella sp. JEL0407]